MDITRISKYHARVTDIPVGAGDFDDRYVEFSGFFGKTGVDVYAAAPDLYEALELLFEHAKLYNPELMNENFSVTSAVLAALAKSRGENAQD